MEKQNEYKGVIPTDLEIGEGGGVSTYGPVDTALPKTIKGFSTEEKNDKHEKNTKKTGSRTDGSEPTIHRPPRRHRKDKKKREAIQSGGGIRHKTKEVDGEKTLSEKEGLHANRGRGGGGFFRW